MDLELRSTAGRERLHSQPARTARISFFGRKSAPSPVLKEDGRIDLEPGVLLDPLGPYARHAPRLTPNTAGPAQHSGWEVPGAAPSSNHKVTTKLNIVIQVVGSRGDVQPFVALGCELQTHGHRVRLATHDVFSSFVREAGLEFYPVGGDPAELMAYMVRNPGLIPSMRSIKAGDVGKKRVMISSIIRHFWRSCIAADPRTGDPFVADAIIANPPSFAHIHCAQALGVPLHMMFTMPWTGTSAFPHPLVNLGLQASSQTKPSKANYLSYGVVEFLTWQGLGDVINKWRSTIDLEPIAFSDGPRLVETLAIPFTYCWSPALVPKPTDWPSHIDVCGFFFREVPPYEPPEALAEFLAAGPPPIYIGFGSIVIDDPEGLSRMILEAVRLTGVRAIISRGWSKLSGPETEQVMFLGDCPHEWLFQQVSAVMHHGGAGTTACGLLYGKPTTIVPFFGDQPFWGNMVAAAGAGPSPIPYKSLTVDKIVQAVQYCLSPEAVHAASHLSQKMRTENGVRQAASSFHAHLPRDNFECQVTKGERAVWSYRTHGKTVRLSSTAAEILLSHHKIDGRKLKRLKTRRIAIDTQRWDPFTATVSATLTYISDIGEAASNVVRNAAKSLHKYQRTDEESAAGESFGDVREQQNRPPPSVMRRIADVFLTTMVAIASLVAVAASGGARIPFAWTEGLRVLPRIWGQDVRCFGHVRGLKSGLVLGAKVFLFALYDALGGLVKRPYQYTRDHGPFGAFVGLFVAVLSIPLLLFPALLSLWTYPLMGVYKAIWHAVNRHTRQSIHRATLQEGQFLARKRQEKGLADQGVLKDYDALL